MSSCCISGVSAMTLIAGMPVLSLADANGNASTGALFPLSFILLIVYCGLICVSSLCGGVLPMLIRLTHTRMQFLVSLVGGLMLGVGFFHQLPHAVAVMPAQGPEGAHALDWCMKWLMFGLLLTFFMLRMFHFHSHEPVEMDTAHDHDCAHDRGHAGALAFPKKASWIGIFLGLSLHTLLDGVALAANIEADSLHNHGNSAFALFGLGTFLGVFLHKPLDSLSITSLMANGGWSPRSMNLVNAGYALMCPIGAALFYFGVQRFSGMQDVIVAAALAMSAGVFICISLSDLLPEVQFHSHDRLGLSAALLLGVGVAWGIGFLEPAHTHEHANVPAVHDHDDRGHQH